MPRMVTVRKVEAGHVHARLDESLQLGHIPAGRADGADDLGTTVERRCLLLDRVEGDEASGEGGNFRGLGDAHADGFVALLATTTSNNE